MGQYLEAKVDSRTLPLSIVAKLKLKENGPDTTSTSDSPSSRKSPRRSRRLLSLLQTLPATRAGFAADASSYPAPLIQVSIPDTIEGIVAEIGIRNRQIGELIELAGFTEVWFPAFEAKDLAIAMGAHAARKPAGKRLLLEPAIRQLLKRRRGCSTRLATSATAIRSLPRTRSFQYRLSGNRVTRRGA